VVHEASSFDNYITRQALIYVAESTHQSCDIVVSKIIINPSNDVAERCLRVHHKGLQTHQPKEVEVSDQYLTEGSLTGRALPS
jgi:hypothetical protein